MMPSDVPPCGQTANGNSTTRDWQRPPALHLESYRIHSGSLLEYLLKYAKETEKLCMFLCLDNLIGRLFDILLGEAPQSNATQPNGGFLETDLCYPCRRASAGRCSFALAEFRFTEPCRNVARKAQRGRRNACRAAHLAGRASGMEGGTAQHRP